ncbi:MAG: class I SAM-dependent methyltransferase [Thermoanaerobaculia bacterium]
MRPQDRQQIANGFGVAPALVPLLGELLRDIWVLGSWPERIVELVGEHTPLPAGSTVLDLGCGKGAVAVPLARELGLRVHGVDLFPSFLEDARERAAAAGVAALCRFECLDLRRAVRRPSGCDLVVLAGVGAGVFGGFPNCVAEMRRAVGPGGFVLVDDGFLLDEEPATEPGYEYYRSRADTVAELTSHGEVLVHEALVPQAELEAYNRRNNRFIRARARGLSTEHPELAEELALFVRSEQEECEFLESRTRAAIWLLRRR